MKNFGKNCARSHLHKTYLRLAPHHPKAVFQSLSFISPSSLVAHLFIQALSPFCTGVDNLKYSFKFSSLATESFLYSTAKLIYLEIDNKSHIRVSQIVRDLN